MRTEKIVQTVLVDLDDADGRIVKFVMKVETEQHRTEQVRYAWYSSPKNIKEDEQRMIQNYTKGMGCTCRIAT